MEASGRGPHGCSPWGVCVTPRPRPAWPVRRQGARPPTPGRVASSLWAGEGFPVVGEASSRLLCVCPSASESPLGDSVLVM